MSFLESLSSLHYSSNLALHNSIKDQRYLITQKIPTNVLSISCSPESNDSDKLDSCQIFSTATKGPPVKRDLLLHNLRPIFPGNNGGCSSISNIYQQKLHNVASSHHGLHCLGEVHRFGIAQLCRSHHLTSCPLTKEHLLQHQRSHLEHLHLCASRQQHRQTALLTEQSSNGNNGKVLRRFLGGMALNVMSTTGNERPASPSSVSILDEEVTIQSPLRVSRVITSGDDLHYLSGSIHCMPLNSTSSLHHNWSNINTCNHSTLISQTMKHNTSNDFCDAGNNKSINECPKSHSSSFSLTGQETFLKQLGDVYMIPIPVSVNEDGPIDRWKRVYRYPTEAVTIVVEKRSYLESTSETGLASSSVSSAATHRCNVAKWRRGKRRGDRDGRLPGRVSSSELSRALTWDTTSNGSSGMSVASSTFSLNATSSGSKLSSHPRNQLKGLAHTDASSCASNISDLSSYETEYIRIKQLISDSPGSPINVSDLSIKSKEMWPTIAEIHDFESAVKDLTTQKEDLEIQVHRLASQLQNTIKEKEMCQEQMETMKASINEVNQRQMFEILKEKADLEGRLEVEIRKRTDTLDEVVSLKVAMSNEVTEKELYKSNCNEIRIKEEEQKLKITSLQNELHCSMLSVSDLKQACAALTIKTGDLESLVNEQNTKVIQYGEQVEKLTCSLSDKTGEVVTLSSTVDRLKQEVKAHQIEKLTYISENEKLSSDLESVTKWQKWLKEQLESGQGARQALQEQLKDTREKVIEMTGQRDANADDAQCLRMEVEETRSRAVRERNALILKLETLQEDLFSYEEQIRKQQNLGHEGNADETQAMQEKLDTLQKDCKKLRLQLIDTERCVGSLEEKVRHKNALINKYENELRELRQAAVVNGEMVVEHNIRLDALVNQINEKNMIINDLKKELLKKETNIKTVREEKMQVDIKLSATLSEKLEVDQATLKVKEDINKLSSSLFRMKHDLTTRDREIVRHKEEISTLHQAKFSLEAQVKGFKDTLCSTTSEEQKIVILCEAGDANSGKCKLEEQLQEKTVGRKMAQSSLNDATNTLDVLELRTKTLSEAVLLRDDEIHSLQQSLREYGELITKKDTELGRAEALRRGKEEECAELNRTVREFNKDVNRLHGKLKEMTVEVEKFKGEIRTLRVSLHKEYKLKNAIEKKLELNNVQFSRERNKLMHDCSTLTKKVQAIEQDHGMTTVELSKVKNAFACKTIDLKLLQEAFEAKTQSVLELEQKIITLKENKPRESDAVLVEETSFVKNLDDGYLTSQKSPCDFHSTDNRGTKKLGESAINLFDVIPTDCKEIYDPSTMLKENTDLLEVKKLETVHVQTILDSVQEQKSGSENTTDGLTNDLEALYLQISSLKDHNCLLEMRLRECEATREEAIESLSCVRKEFKCVTEERDQWQASYQSLQELVDTIPQRDTDSCFARVAVGSVPENAVGSASAVTPAVVGAVKDDFDDSTSHVSGSKGLSGVSKGSVGHHLSSVAGGDHLAGGCSPARSESTGKGQPDPVRTFSDLQQRVLLTSDVLSVKEKTLSTICLQMNEQSKMLQNLSEEVATSKNLLCTEKMCKEGAENKLLDEKARNDSLSANLKNLTREIKSFKNESDVDLVPGNHYPVQSHPERTEVSDGQQQMVQCTPPSVCVEQLESNFIKLTTENKGYKLRDQQQKATIDNVKSNVSELKREQYELHKESAESKLFQELLSNCECQKNESVKKMIESECSKTDFMKQVSELKYRNGTLTKQVENLERSNDEQNHRINEFIKITNDTNFKLNESDRVSIDLMDQVLLLESQKKDLISGASDATNRNSSLVEQLARIESAWGDHQKQLIEAQTRCNNLSEQLTKAETHEKDMIDKLSAAQTNYTDLCHRFNELQGSKESLTKEFTDLKLERNALLKKVVESEAECETLLKHASESESQRRVLQEKTSEMQLAHETLQMQLTESTAKQRRCESNINLLTRKLREHLKGRKEAESEATRLRQQAEETDEAARLEVAAIKQRLLATEAALDSAQATGSCSDARLREVQKQQEQQQEALQQRQQELLVLRQRLAAAEETEAAKLRLEKDAQNTALELKNLQAERLELKSDLKSLKRQLANGARQKEDVEARVVQLQALATEATELRSSSSKLRAEIATVTAERELSKKHEGKLNVEVQELMAAQLQLKEELQHVSRKKKEVEEKLELEKRRRGDEQESHERLARDERNMMDVLNTQLERSAAEVGRLQAALNDVTADCERREKDYDEALAMARQDALCSRHKVSELEERVSALTARLARSERELNVAVSERLSALSTNTELRTALSDSLRQIRTAMTPHSTSVHDGAEKYHRVLEKGAPPTPSLSPPSPAPLDSVALQALLERAQAVDRGSLKPLASLQGSLASFKQELSSLQDAVHRSTQRYLAGSSTAADLDKYNLSDSRGNEKQE